MYSHFTLQKKYVSGTAHGTLHAFTTQELTETGKWAWSDVGSTLTSDDDASVTHAACSSNNDHVAVLCDHVCKVWIVG